jgi:hypothetical protein
MARRAQVDKEQTGNGENIVTAEALAEAIAEINLHKKDASEASGLAGKATAAAVQRFGCEKNALTFTARLAAMESTKRNSVIMNLISFVITQGWLDQMDMFTRQQLEDLIHRTSNGPAQAA